jgi:chromosome segregation ATPase
MFDKSLKKRGIINIKFYIIPTLIGGLVLSLSMTQIYKKERSNLLQQLNLIIKQNDELSIRLSTILKSKNKITSFKKGISSGREKPINPASMKQDSSDKVTKVRDAEKSLSRLKDYMKNIEEQNSSLKERLSQLNISLDAREKELLKSKEDNLAVKENLDKTIEANNVLKTELEANLNNLKNQLTQKEQDLISLNKIKSDLERQTNEANNKIFELSGINSYLEKQIASNQQDNSSLEMKLNETEGELNKQISITDTLNKRIIELTDELGKKERDRLNVVSELEQLKQSKGALELELNGLKLIKANNENQINELQSNIKELHSSSENMKSTIFSLSNSINKKELEISEKQAEIMRIKESLEKTNKERNDSVSSLIEKEKHISDLKDILIRMESQMKALDDELDLSKKSQQKTKDELGRLTLVNSSLQKKLFNISMELELIQAEKNEKNVENKSK